MRTRLQKARQATVNEQKEREHSLRLTTTIALLLEILDWEQLRTLTACISLTRSRILPPHPPESPLLLRQLRNVEVLSYSTTAVAAALRRRANIQEVSLDCRQPSPAPALAPPGQRRRRGPQPYNPPSPSPPPPSPSPSPSDSDPEFNSKSLSAISNSETQSSSSGMPIAPSAGPSSPSTPPTN